MTKIKISPLAELDFDESVLSYNLQKEGLGQKFTVLFSDIIKRILLNPKQFPAKYRYFRKAKMDGFPFHVFSIYEQDIAYIPAIFHASRNPRLLNQRQKI